MRKLIAAVLLLSASSAAFAAAPAVMHAMADCTGNCPDRRSDRRCCHCCDAERRQQAEHDLQQRVEPPRLIADDWFQASVRKAAASKGVAAFLFIRRGVEESFSQLGLTIPPHRRYVAP